MKEFNDTIMLCDFLLAMDFNELTDEQLIEVLRLLSNTICSAHISIKNPRYDEYEVILQILTKSIQSHK